MYSFHCHKASTREHLKEGRIPEAVGEYDAAAALLPCGDEHVHDLQEEIASVYFKRRQAGKAAEWSRKALEGNPEDVKVRVQLVRSLAATGDFHACSKVLEEAPTQHDSLDDAYREIQAVESQLTSIDAELEAGHVDAALEISRQLEDGALFDCPSLLVRMGSCYLSLGDIQRAVNISTSLLRREPSDVAALVLRAEGQFQAVVDHIDTDAWSKGADEAMRTVRQALALDPENKKAAKTRRQMRGFIQVVQKVRSTVKDGNHKKAEDLLSGMIDGTVCAKGRFAARCLAERGNARLQQGNFDGCIVDCTAAARLDDRLTAAPVYHAQALQKKELWDDAVKVLEDLHGWNKDNDVFWKVEWAKFEVRRVRRPKYYEILGLEPTCSMAEARDGEEKISAKVCRQPSR